MRDQRGFTLIETLIVVVIAVIVAGGLAYMLSGGRRTSRIAELDAQAQQNARVAVDMLVKDLRSNGYGIDLGNGQQTLVYGGPYDVVFNANIAPVPDDGSTPGHPSAINTASSPATVPASGTALYSPAMTFQTGAETYRFTLDSNNDGSITADDRADDTIEQTANPFDYALIRQIYGYDGSSNGGNNEIIALLRGPGAYDNGDYPYPLFTYWYDHDDDASTPDRLWGDTSNNGTLEQGEIAALTPMGSVNLSRVNRIRITAIGTARATDIRHDENQGFRETVIASEVAVTRSRRTGASFIRGTVYDDFNGDGERQGGEAGIQDVLVTLNTGAQKLTTATGQYSFRVDPGSYTVTEIDPTGYTSTTPNSVPVTVTKGSVAGADFGDRAMGGYGSILGGVLLWDDETGDLAPTEEGVAGVEIYLNSGERDTTDENGAFSFYLPVTTYTVTMVVPGGYAAVGPTSFDKTLAADGDTALVVFGLVEAGATGIIEGTVYLDSNEDGVFDDTEPGIPTVTIMLSRGDSTVTDADGRYSFTVPPGTYDVTETDLLGYSSTTINNISGVVVEADSTVVVNFGDFLAADLSFTVITLGETQRALCITSADLGEDDKGDKEIILGTKYVSGESNLNVWFNQWVNSSTPNASIFEQNPTYSRTPGEDILSVDAGRVNGDGTNDVVTGLTSASGKVLIWITRTTGGPQHKGRLPDIPTDFFISNGIADVLSTVLYPIDSDEDNDILIGTEHSYPLGRLEVWFNDGSGNYSSGFGDMYEWTGAVLMGTARSVAIGNVAGSPADDVVIGTATGINTGKIEIFRDSGAPNGKFTYFGTIEAFGEVNAIVVRDMLEDSDGDDDIIAGSKAGTGVGWVEVWHNNGDGTFGEYRGGAYVPSDTVQVPGEVLCLGVENLGRDVYPDVVVGLKRAGTYSGEIRAYSCYGYMPSADNCWISPDIGEAITLTLNDFNQDWTYDFAVGTRTSSSRGHVVVFFND